MASDTQHPETLALHAGWRADSATGAVQPPIYQTTSYQFESSGLIIDSGNFDWEAHKERQPLRRGTARHRRGYVRLSVGLEHIDDILADLGQALAAA